MENTKNTTEEINIDSKQIIEEYLNDEKIKNQINETSTYFYNISKGNWIDIDRLIKKSFFKNEQELKNILDLILLSKRALSKNVKGKIIYKFTLTKEDRVKGLVSHIEYLKQQISILEKELIDLKK